MSIVTVPAAGQFGYIADALPQELPVNAWSYARNVRFSGGYAERFKGDSSVLTTPLIAPYFISSYRSASARFWVYAGTTKAYVDDGATQSDISPAVAFTGNVDDRWTGGSASGVMVINNGIDQPHFWGGNVATPFAPLTGWTSTWRAASVRPFKQYLVALDITKGSTRLPNMVKWSAAADPGSLPASWDESDPTKDAGEVDLAETSDFLVDQLQLGDLNVIYKDRSMYGMQYIGAPFIFRTFRLPGDVGMLARGCGVDTPVGHVVLTAGDVIRHNGQGPQSIVTDRMRKWLFSTIDATHYARSFVASNPAMNEVWICFPASGATACTLALVWNHREDTFAVRELSNVTCSAIGQLVVSTDGTWASDTGTWDSDTTIWNNDGFGAVESSMLMGSTTPRIALMEEGALFAGANPSSILERTGLAFDAPESVKTVRSVVPRIDAIAGTELSIQVGGSMDAEASPTWSAAVPYIVGTTRKADLFASGRFLALRICSTGAQPWRLRSFDLDIVGGGKF